MSIGNAPLRDRVAAARKAVARGQTLFNSKPIQIRDVKGLNDALGDRHHSRHMHDLPQLAERRQSFGAAAARYQAWPMRRGAQPDMPLYTLRNKTSTERRLRRLTRDVH